MKKSVLNLVVFGLLLTSTTMAQKNMTADQQAVLKAVEKMTSAFVSKDIMGVMNSYEKEALVVFKPELPVIYGETLKEMFQNAFMLNPTFTYSGHEVFITGDIATHIAPWVMTGTTPDGQQVKQEGLSVAVLRKQKNGDWLMVIDNPHGQFLMNK